jgi:predicted site-specific integrase-resolvase
MTVNERLEKIEAMLVILIERQSDKRWYSTGEFAQLVGKAEFTVRQWCRLGRIHAEKKDSGRGAHDSWAISQKELLRYQHEGLLRKSVARAGRYADGIAP